MHVYARQVATLADLCAERTDLSADEVDALAALVAEWSLLADLGFSDLILWLPTWNNGGFIAGAQVRPTTGPTRVVQDMVGQFQARGRSPLLDRVLANARPESERNELRPLIPLADEAFPIVREERVIAVVQRLCGIDARSEGTLERTYLEAFDALSMMAIIGEFPQGDGVGHSSTPPRVGDGLLRLDADGMVVYASPNAMSACHRRPRRDEALCRAQEAGQARRCDSVESRCERSAKSGTRTHHQRCHDSRDSPPSEEQLADRCCAAAFAISSQF